MKPTKKNLLLVALSLLVIVGTMVITTSCGPKKQKIDDTTVLPFKDKAELDRILNLPFLPEYSIEEYYTNTDIVSGDQQFVVCCKFLEEVTPDQVQEIVKKVDNGPYSGWYTFDLGKENNMRLFFDLDTTLTADHKRPDFLGDYIHVGVELMCREKDSWKGFEVVFRNNRADFSVVVDRDTLSKVLGVEFPPVTETNRSDEDIYFDFDTVPPEEFYQALEKAPHWSVSHHGKFTFYYYDYDDGNTWVTADIIKGKPEFTFHRSESLASGKDVISEIKNMTPLRDKDSEGESN